MDKERNKERKERMKNLMRNQAGEAAIHAQRSC